MLDRIYSQVRSWMENRKRNQTASDLVSGHAHPSFSQEGEDRVLLSLLEAFRPGRDFFCESEDKLLGDDTRAVPSSLDIRQALMGEVDVMEEDVLRSQDRHSSHDQKNLRAVKTEEICVSNLVICHPMEDAKSSRQGLRGNERNDVL
jgi:hypothetical protein